MSGSLMTTISQEEATPISLLTLPPRDSLYQILMQQESSHQICWHHDLRLPSFQSDEIHGPLFFRNYSEYTVDASQLETRPANREREMLPKPCAPLQSTSRFLFFCRARAHCLPAFLYPFEPPLASLPLSRLTITLLNEQ